jgi:hypothetical protein
MIFCLDNSFDNPANKFLELFYILDRLLERHVVENERGSRQENWIPTKSEFESNSY